MGGVFGFTGSPNGELANRISSTLLHRGTAIVETTPSGTIGYIDHGQERAKGESATGIARNGDVVLAVSGWLCANEFSHVDDLLARYQGIGISFSESLRGAFILAVMDGDTLYVVRDGSGGRTVYYGRHDGRVIFAVEPKGVLATPGFPKRIRAAAVAQYLTFSFVPGDRTILEDLYEVRAGHRIKCEGGSDPTETRYFCFEQIEQSDEAQSDDYWVERFRELFSSAVADRLPDAQPVGVFLSGGLDSSVVTAELMQQLGRPVKSYAIHFGHEYPNELEFARSVADMAGTDHQEVLVTPNDFLPRMRQMVWHLDEPIGDPITLPNYELASVVSKDVRHVFNGEGGDPCFGGPKNIPMLIHHWYGVDRPENFREKAYLASYRRGYEEISRLLTPELQSEIDERRDLEGLVQPFFETNQPAGFLEKMLAINIRLKGAHLILPKVERMTGAHGIVPHSPLFDERLVRLVFQMPGRMKLNRGIEKVVIKQAYRDLVPKPVIDRPKSGMRVPVHYWFQREMRQYAKKLLSPKRVREVGIFDPKRVKQLLRYDTEEGPGRYGLRLWMLITFEVWRRLVVDGESL